MHAEHGEGADHAEDRVEDEHRRQGTGQLAAAGVRLGEQTAGIGDGGCITYGGAGRITCGAADSSRCGAGDRSLRGGGVVGTGFGHVGFSS